MKILRYSFLILLGIVFSGLFLQSCLDSTSSEDNEQQPQPYSHTLNPGNSANDFLADSNFTELVVEIDYMEGYAPNEEALDSLQAFLEQRLNKTSVTLLEPTVIELGGQDSYSADEIRAMEQDHRDEYTENSDSDQLTAYMIIIDGYFNENNNVLGIAYYNTSNAFFGEAYNDVSSGGTSRYKVEATSFRHEFGHLFGLVNIEGSGTKMQEPHQGENGHHCDNDSCLMYYAMERSNLFEMVFGEEVPELDNNCILDLRANGGR